MMPQWSSPWPCQASVFLYISPSDSLPALLNNNKSSLWYPWFLGTQTFSKNLSCSKIESTFVMTPHGFKGLILWGGGSKFWGNIRRILPIHVNIRKRWQVWDEVFGLRLSRSLKLKLQCLGQILFSQPTLKNLLWTLNLNVRTSMSIPHRCRTAVMLLMQRNSWHNQTQA